MSEPSAEKDAGRPEHVHDVSCSFGNPQCPAFGEPEPPRRPWRSRVWFWKPSWYWHGWKTLIPFFTGGDEFDWHTVCLGWTITGRVIIATRPCPRTGKCADVEYLAAWPVDGYGWDWSNGKPTAEDYEALDQPRVLPPGT